MHGSGGKECNPHFWEWYRLSKLWLQALSHKQNGLVPDLNTPSLDPNDW